jgi:N-acetylmuramoyl-L-alanine amidase
MTGLTQAIIAVCLSLGAHAQEASSELSGLARVNVEDSIISDGWRGSVEINLGLTQGVPWRIFSLDEPRRLVLDFREIDWQGVSKETLLQSELVSDVRFGIFRPGWSRMVLDLTAPLLVETAELRIDEVLGTAQLSVKLHQVGIDAYSVGSGAPHDPRWDLPEPSVAMGNTPAKPEWAPLVVMLDPGHGGIDPGAQADGALEKDLMLAFAREIRDTLRRAGGFEVLMTRDEDRFVSLEGRVAMAHRLQADVFISLHADVLHKGHASGATVYTLSDDASDKASQLLAERHDRAEILAGLDLSKADDAVADVLLDLARMETKPRTQKLALAMVLGMERASGELNKKPYREAGFSVLKAADIPSVLIEAGFMSSEKDLENLRNPEWRSAIAAGIRDGLQAWIIADKAAQGLVRH